MGSEWDESKIFQSKLVIGYLVIWQINMVVLFLVQQQFVGIYILCLEVFYIVFVSGMCKVE